MSGRRINVAFLWHMHQPPYEDPRTGAFLLPWTWLHGIKDYFDMGALVGRHPGMRVNVNFTPSLLLQLEQYAAGSVRDQTLDVILRDPADLSDSDREFLVRTCLMSCPPAFLARFPRYRQLNDFLHASASPAAAAASMEPDEIVDLTVLFLLAWCGPELSADPKVIDLADRGSGFEPGDRNALVELGMGLIRRIVPLYRELSESGRVELSASPFYHPLSPLLVTSSSAREADPGLELPQVRFEAQGELSRQIRTGLDYFADVMGAKPAGMWPPEGAVSEPAIRAYGEAGVRWLASDEEVLRRSLGGQANVSERLRPWDFEGVSLFFRNREISDHIGFVYSRWPAEKSVGHFMEAVEDLADRAEGEDALCIVALDGENAWEFYPDGGYPFLDRLYTAIEESDFARSVTFSDYIDEFGRGEALDQVATGSWIDGNLDTWIGDPVKNRAWDYLTTAFQAARDVPGARCLQEAGQHLDHAKKCRLMRAEASDWFWWFGRGHDSVHEREFDYLFRQNLRMIYKDLGLTTPDYLSRPVDDGWAPVPVTAPTAYISPDINGRNDGFYKWVGAGRCEFRHGSIHRQQPLVSSVGFGFDRKTLYFRVEGFDRLGDMMASGGWVKVHFARPGECAVVVRAGDGAPLVEKACPDEAPAAVDGGRAAAGDVLEIAIPTAFFATEAGCEGPFTIEFCVVLGEGDLELERFPWDSVISMRFDPDAFEMENWFV